MDNTILLYNYVGPAYAKRLMTYLFWSLTTVTYSY